MVSLPFQHVKPGRNAGAPEPERRQRKTVSLKVAARLARLLVNGTGVLTKRVAPAEAKGSTVPSCKVACARELAGHTVPFPFPSLLFDLRKEIPCTATHLSGPGM